MARVGSILRACAVVCACVGALGQLDDPTPTMTPSASRSASASVMGSPSISATRTPARSVPAALSSLPTSSPQPEGAPPSESATPLVPSAPPLPTVAEEEKDLFQLVNFQINVVGATPQEVFQQEVVQILLEATQEAIAEQTAEISPSPMPAAASGGPSGPTGKNITAINSTVVISGFQDRSVEGAAPARLLRQLQSCASTSATLLSLSVRTTVFQSTAVAAAARGLLNDFELQRRIAEALARATTRPAECFDAVPLPFSVAIAPLFTATPTPAPTTEPGISGGAIAAAVIGALVGAACLLGIIVFAVRKSRTDEEEDRRPPQLRLATPGSVRGLRIVPPGPGVVLPPQTFPASRIPSPVAQNRTIIQVPGPEGNVGYENRMYQHQTPRSMRAQSPVRVAATGV